MKLLFLLTLQISFLFQTTFSAATQDKRVCIRQLVETYNLSSYAEARPMNMYICPRMEYSCCSVYDQFLMFTHWKKVIRKKLTKYYKSINDKILHTKELVEEIQKLDLGGLIDRLKITDKKKRRIKTKYEYLKTKNIDVLLEKLMGLHNDNSKYLMTFRSAFYCSICDWESHAFFDLKNKLIHISEESCGDLAENTINFSYILNVVVAPLLIDLTEITGNFSLSSTEPPSEIKDFRHLKKEVKKCGSAFRNGTGGGKVCKKYCGYYNFNSNSPVIEGYQVFFNDVMNALSKFLKHVGLPNERRLASLVYRTEKITHPSRVLQTVFTKDQLLRIKDPYADNHVDPTYNSYTLNKMFNFQSDYDKDREQGYINFVKNRLHYFDVQPDFESKGKLSVFKTSTHKVVDLENFKTLVAPIGGVDIENHADTTNIDNSMKELISHLKLKTKYKIYYEKLDPTLLAQINDITNFNVKDYHRDNYLFFKDFSLELKKGEIMSQYEEIKKVSKQIGYDIQ